MIPAVFLNKSCTYTDGTGAECIDTVQFPSSMGICLELCAGIIDEDISPQETARQELLEECGYDVPLENIRLITSFK